ncbi:MAG: aldehyde dehydrogenase family protein, partial [Polaromonas sp.]
MKHRIPLPPSLAQIRNYVAGDFVTTAKQFPNISPINGARLAEVHEADAALVDRAVQAARAALNGPWGKMAPAERAAVLHKVADGIERRFEEFVAAEVADTGRPVA